jgi:GNAT superfamily N-acetyltransferase
LIEITEEPYDSPVATALVLALMADLDDRYAEEDAAAAAAADGADDHDYLAEVTPELVRPPLGAFLVAWLEGEPAGCGALKPLPADPTVGEIKRMYTMPSARRRGVSRHVLVHLEAAAERLGYGRIQLETGLAQPEAMALYESHGWHRITPYGHYRHSPQSVCFAKDLSPS